MDPKANFNPQEEQETDQIERASLDTDYLIGTINIVIRTVNELPTPTPETIHYKYLVQESANNILLRLQYMDATYDRVVRERKGKRE